MIDKDKLHAFLFATLFPNETSDDRRYGEGFRRLARDKAFEKATDLTDYYVERSEMEKVLPKGVDLPHFKYELRKFFDDVIQSTYEHEKPYSYGVRIVDINNLKIPREGKIITLWGIFTSSQPLRVYKRALMSSIRLSSQMRISVRSMMRFTD